MKHLMILSTLALVFGHLHAVKSQDKSTKASPTLTNAIGMKLVLIPAGEFLMGSPDSDKDALPDEKPQQCVRITKPFYMGVYEVTQEEYEKVMGVKGSFFSPAGPGKDKVKGLDTRRFPAEQVRWHDAVEFCRRLSALAAEKKAGRVYRLPTEAEWEYACRAGTKTAFHFGNSLSSRQANFNGNHPHGGAVKGPFLVRTTEVGSYPANAFGLYDMHGNVWEWCADWYGVGYYKNSPVDDPPGPKTGSARVIRGGEWYADGRDCRSAFRYADLPDGTFYVMGFRVVMQMGGPPPDSTDPVGKKPAKETSPREVLPEVLAGEDWPQFRGRRGDGTWKGPPLPEKWPDGGLPLIWRQPIGGGHAGVVVSKGRVITMDYRPKPEPRERVVCFHAGTGKMLWSHAYPVNYKRLAYDNGPRAAPTVWQDRVFALGAVGRLTCLDLASGKPIWSVDLVKDHRAGAPTWGFAASPLVYQHLLSVHAGAEPDGCFLALDQDTGKEVWRSLPDPAGYATPILIHHEGKAQLVGWTPTHVRGLEPRTGKLLWSIPFEVTYGTSIAMPIFQENIVLVTGYYEGAKAIRLEKGSAKVVWHDRLNLRGLMCQPLYRAGHVYLLDRRHGLSCVELRTGKKLWDDGHRMTPKGRNPQATLVWLGDADRTIILNSDGDLILARLNPSGYHEQARANILGPTWAHPAYAGSCVYARNDHELVCVLLREAK